MNPKFSETLVAELDKVAKQILESRNAIQKLQQELVLAAYCSYGESPERDEQDVKVCGELLAEVYTCVQNVTRAIETLATDFNAHPSTHRLPQEKL